ncbi:unnamed protein product [Spirodela intermedia]|uniref:Kinesin motor domain-containing protein n=1 Tax=Spirodela intermedia TaxID=51605 RepID=A0A7I8L435_SPIIN|nr:unnamed protein product [Spirodela intermedia]
MKAFFRGKGGKVTQAVSLTPNSHKKKRPSSRGQKENVDPLPCWPLSENCSLRAPSVPGRAPPAPAGRSPLPPRPPPNPSETPFKKKKLNLENTPGNGAPAATVLDSGVQIIVRMRPPKEEEEGNQIVQKMSANSISIIDHTFTFDAVADARSTQGDIFQLVGLPLVENCLAGFNSSIFAYGQTGSGKTHTMWGPTSALLENGSLTDERGLMPRVFDQLFARISQEELKHSDRQLNFQCHCSFLEIYNEQITDLLNPSQRNLQIREDVRIGVYVDCLSEEYVCNIKDVAQLLSKGLANRRISATSMNAESSRSHCVFTCVVESRSKSIADGINSLKISRINLVDLAGSERQKLTCAAGERLKEAGNINRSLSQLGNVINILAEVSQSGKQRHIPYRDSKLTFLLQESLGGNAKLAMICAISPSQSCKSETFSTLRFAQRAKAIQNKAVVNEIKQDDVNVLRDQIRQLKEELLRMRSGVSAESNGSYSTGWNARRSLNLLKMSLCRPTKLPVIDDENDEEMEIDEEDVEKPCTHLYPQSRTKEENDKDVRRGSLQKVNPEESSPDSDGDKATDEETIPKLATTVRSSRCCQIPKKAAGLECCESGDPEMSVPFSSSFREDSTPETAVALQDCTSLNNKSSCAETSACFNSSADKKEINVSGLDSHHNSTSASPDSAPCDLSVVAHDSSLDLHSPNLRISQAVDNNTKEGLKISSLLSTPHDGLLESQKPGPEGTNLSFAQLKCSKSLTALVPREHLAASLHHGLQILDSHMQKSPVGRSSVRFSFRPVDIKPLSTVVTNDVGIQTISSELEVADNEPAFVCSNCQNEAPLLEHRHPTDCDELPIVPSDGLQSVQKSKKQLPKAVEKVLAGAIRREMALEDHCVKQNSEIIQLKRLIQQYKQERECNVLIDQLREEKISRLESLMDGILPAEEFIEEEFASLLNEHKLLKEKYDNHPEVLRINTELVSAQDELERYRNFFDLGEREVLMDEIQDLKSHLQYYVDNSPIPPRKTTLLGLARLSEPIQAPVVRTTGPERESVAERFEEERRRWTETESEWVSLSEELRLELEASRSLAENLKMELDSEKKCSVELKEALQAAMQGHTRILDQYADLQEKHMGLLARHQQIREGIEDIKQAAAKAGVKGAESKFVNSLAAQVSALRAEREKERRYWKDENKGLQAQLKDMAEAVQAAGELLVRLKDAEEASAIAQRRTVTAEKEAERARQEMDNLKKEHDKEIDALKQILAESRLAAEALRPAGDHGGGGGGGGSGGSVSSQQWREEFEPLYDPSEFSKGAEEASWFSGYDQCNI